jgi:hypothetical protein
MNRPSRARVYSLVLDPSDKMAAVLIAAIDMYLAIKQAERPITSDKFGATCPICGAQFANETERRSRQALSAHMRQIHPREYAEWRATRL